MAYDERLEDITPEESEWCYREGMKLYRARKYKAALEKFMLASLYESAYDAQYMVGVCYYEGKGVQTDYEEAACFWEVASRYNPHACLRLGYCYLEGHGVGRDEKKAVYWFKETYGLCQERRNALKVIARNRYIGRFEAHKQLREVAKTRRAAKSQLKLLAKFADADTKKAAQEAWKAIKIWYR